ncbi:unnamed protein product [Closterium sp. NIES-65]|nr:unnamed protein product [Closterium sp. NIES-65]
MAEATGAQADGRASILRSMGREGGGEGEAGEQLLQAEEQRRMRAPGDAEEAEEDAGSWEGSDGAQGGKEYMWTWRGDGRVNAVHLGHPLQRTSCRPGGWQATWVAGHVGGRPRGWETTWVGGHVGGRPHGGRARGWQGMWVAGWVDGRACGWQGGWMAGHVGGRVGGWQGMWVAGWVDGRACGWQGGWMAGHVGGRVGGWQGMWVAGWVDGRACGWQGGWMAGHVGGRVGGWQGMWVAGHVDGRACGWQGMWMAGHVGGRACGWQGMWVAGHVGGRACGWQGMWVAGHVGGRACGWQGMWVAGHVGGRACGWQGMWVAGHVGGRACGWQGMWVAGHVGGRACGWQGMWVAGHVGGRACGWQGMWVGLTVTGGCMLTALVAPAAGSVTGRSGAESRGEMVARMQVQFAAMEKEAAHKDTVLERLLTKPRKSTKQQMRVVEERSRVEKDELRREMAEQQQQRMHRAWCVQELESAAGREERMRRQLMEAQEGIVHRDAFLQQLQEEAALSASALKQAARMGWGGVGWGGVELAVVAWVGKRIAAVGRGRALRLCAQAGRQAGEQAMVAARDRTLRIEEQLESMGDQLAKERTKTRRERDNTVRVTAVPMLARLPLLLIAPLAISQRILFLPSACILIIHSLPVPAPTHRCCCCVALVRRRVIIMELN